MFKLNEKYLIQRCTVAVFIGETATHYRFKGENITFEITKANTQSASRVFKFIKL